MPSPKKTNKNWAKKRAAGMHSQPSNIRVGNPIRYSVPLRSLYEKELNRLLQPMLLSLQELVESLHSVEGTTPPASGQHLTTDAAKKKSKWGSWREYIASGSWMDEEKYQEQFDAKSMKAATWLAKRVQANVDGQWNKSVETMGFPEFKAKFSNGVWRVMEGVVEENVNLIKSIPKKHFAMVRTAVTNSIRKGGDLEALTKRLEAIKGITARRAAFIARDQLNKATQDIIDQRELENGITKGRWVHSLARVHPRKSHLAAGKKGLLFDLKKGAWLKDDNTGKYEYVKPGRKPNCGCTHRAVIIIGGEEF